MKLITAKELAEQWELPLSRVYDLARQNVIPTVRIGRQVRFSEEALRKFIENGGLFQAEEERLE